MRPAGSRPVRDLSRLLLGESDGSAMSDSLRDQLLKAGLVSKTKVAEAERQQSRKQHRQAKSGIRSDAEEKQKRQAAASAQAAKAARDRKLNDRRREKIAARACAAEIRQLIEQHALPRPEGEEYYNFIAGKKIRRIAVNAELLEKLARGDIAIVWHEGRSAVVPADAAARIRERNERAVIEFGAGSGEPETVDEDDPYKEFVVPDDLRW